jgi:hypothetical protein
MQSIRWLRLALGIAVTWAAACALAGCLVAAGIVVAFNAAPYARDVLLASTGICASSGFVGGFAFSLLLSTAYRSRPASGLRLATMSAWGAVAGVLLPAAWVVASIARGAAPMMDVTALGLTILALIGALAGMSTIVIARRAERHVPAP